MSIATSVNWAINIIVSMTFLTMLSPTEGIGVDGTFFFYGGCSLLGLIVMIVIMPETKVGPTVPA